MSLCSGGVLPFVHPEFKNGGELLGLNFSGSGEVIDFHEIGEAGPWNTEYLGE